MTALIIGAGLAGISTAAWLARYDAPFEWVDASGDLGGMLATVHNPIVDYPGVDGTDGAAVVDRVSDWLAGLSVSPRKRRVEHVRATADGFVVRFDTGLGDYSAVVLATGTRRRPLGVPGEAEGLGDYVLMSTTRDPSRFVGASVAVVGGADAAVEGCLNLAEAGADRVWLLARSKLKAQRKFIIAADEHHAIHQGPVAEIVRLERRDGGCRIYLDDDSTLDVDALFVRIGVEPVMPDLKPLPDLDEAGFLVVDSRCETDIEGLFAVGDVTSTPLRSIATSVGDGARAGRAVAELLGMWP